jgi:hypothetical protein
VELERIVGLRFNIKAHDLKACSVKAHRTAARA